MAYFGAGGATEQELAQVMGVADMDKLQVMKAYLYDKAFQTVREKNEDKGYKLIHANRMFFDRSIPLNKRIQLLLNNELGAVDFQQNPEKARKQINSWVRPGRWTRRPRCPWSTPPTSKASGCLSSSPATLRSTTFTSRGTRSRFPSL